MTTTIESAAMTIRAPGEGFVFDEAQLAAVSFLARYSGWTFEAYRHDLQGFFRWAADHGVSVLAAAELQLRAQLQFLDVAEEELSSRPPARHWPSRSVRADDAGWASGLG